MAHHLRTAGIAAVLLTLVACGSGRPVRVAGPRVAQPQLGEIPVLQEPQFGGASGSSALGKEQFGGEVTAAAPPGLHITSVSISPLSDAARKAIKFKGFQNGNGPGLIELPIYGVDPQIGMYYLIVPVINEGPEPVRNLKARADFYDANGIIVWSETQAVTHFPTRLGLNPPSLPNSSVPDAGPLGSSIKGFGLYYFAGNVGLFTFAVPDTAVAKTVTDWKLTFLVSTT